MRSKIRIICENKNDNCTNKIREFDICKDEEGKLIGYSDEDILFGFILPNKILKFTIFTGSNELFDYYLDISYDDTCYYGVYQYLDYMNKIFYNYGATKVIEVIIPDTDKTIESENNVKKQFLLLKERLNDKQKEALARLQLYKIGSLQHLLENEKRMYEVGKAKALLRNAK